MEIMKMPAIEATPLVSLHCSDGELSVQNGKVATDRPSARLVARGSRRSTVDRRAWQGEGVSMTEMYVRLSQNRPPTT